MTESRLRADALTLAYDRRVVVRDLDVQITDGSFTVIVGPNACGKSTLLRSLARVLKPQSGAVYLNGQTIASQPSKQVARQLGMLPQSLGRARRDRAWRIWSPGAASPISACCGSGRRRTRRRSPTRCARPR